MTIVCSRCDGPLVRASCPTLFGVTPFSDLAYAKRLAVHLWEQHYKEDAPHWEPLDDMTGVLTQIDNMITGLTRVRGHGQ